jgi:hypothetical protein
MLSPLALSNDRRWYGLLQLAAPLAFGFILTLVCGFAGNAQPANSGETEGQEQDTSTRTAPDPRGWSPCPMVASAAAAYDIPLSFFMRLIWQESRFNQWAISGAGAQGIAQFMPNTAQDRHLINPFDPVEALPKSAELLKDLKNQFGNFGLAAAAYNAGPTRVRAWLDGIRQLPAETLAYVRIVTGRTAHEWASGRASLEPPPPANVPCPEFADGRHSAPGVRRDPRPNSDGKWFVQLFGDRSEAKLLSEYRKLEARHSSLFRGVQPTLVHTTRLGTPFWHRLRIEKPERQAAEYLCSKLRSVGETCIVQRN